MRAKITEAARQAHYAEAQELARQRATQWRLWARDKDGAQLAAWHIVDASSEEAAIIAVCDKLGIRRSDARAPTKAVPLLKSSEWREIHAEVAKEGLA